MVDLIEFDVSRRLQYEPSDGWFISLITPANELHKSVYHLEVFGTSTLQPGGSPFDSSEVTPANSRESLMLYKRPAWVTSFRLEKLEVQYRSPASYLFSLVPPSSNTSQRPTKGGPPVNEGEHATWKKRSRSPDFPIPYCHSIPHSP